MRCYKKFNNINVSHDKIKNQIDHYLFHFCSNMNENFFLENSLKSSDINETIELKNITLLELANLVLKKKIKDSIIKILNNLVQSIILFN
jgi:hypothetical protein